MYVCNCNGIREREVRAAIDAGATRPAEVFRHKGCQALTLFREAEKHLQT
ncbi:MAG: (2Fe-2S)-binding protein [Caulobacter sp.]|nr:(2Fe-2S)-binding protein [Caulobacter sp.]